MFLIFGSQHALQSLQALSCFGAGHVAWAGSVVTVEVLGQLAGAAWSTIVAENLITRLAGARSMYFLTHASRVGIQCWTSGLSLHTSKILSK